MMKRSFLLGIAILIAQTHIANALTFSSEVAPEIRKRILSDIAFIKTVETKNESALHEKIFGKITNTTGKHYTQWFESRIHRISKRSCGGLEFAIACVMPLFMGPNEMGITKNYIQLDHPQVARATVLFHEARHTELNPRVEGQKDERYWLHDLCPTEFNDERGKPMISIWSGVTLAGKGACDSNILGSYGITAILLKNIAENCTNCNEKIKADAELYSIDQAQRLISSDAIRHYQSGETPDLI